MVLQGESPVKSVVFSPDGERVMSVGDDLALNAWDAHAGHRVRAFGGLTSQVKSVVWSPETDVLAAVFVDDTAEVLDSRTGGRLARCEAPVLGVLLIGQAEWVLVRGDDGTVRIQDLRTHGEICSLEEPLTGIECVAVSPEAGRVALGGELGYCGIWDINDGRTVCTIKHGGHDSWIACVSFSPDGKKFVTGSWDRTVRVWDTETGECLAVFMGHTGDVTDLAFSRDGKRIASASQDGTIRIWDLRAEQILEPDSYANAKNICLGVFSPEGQMVAYVTEDAQVGVWDLHANEQVFSSLHRGERPTCLALSPGGDRLVVGFEEGTIQSWRIATYEQLFKANVPAEPMRALSYAPDGRRIVSRSDTSVVRVWNAETGECLVAVPRSKAHVAEHAPSSADPKWFFDDDGSTIVETLCSGEIVGRFPEGVNLIASHPSGRVWATFVGDALCVLALERLGGGSRPVGAEPPCGAPAWSAAQLKDPDKAMSCFYQISLGRGVGVVQSSLSSPRVIGALALLPLGNALVLTCQSLKWVGWALMFVGAPPWFLLTFRALLRRVARCTCGKCWGPAILQQSRTIWCRKCGLWDLW